MPPAGKVAAQHEKPAETTATPVERSRLRVWRNWTGIALVVVAFLMCGLYYAWNRAGSEAPVSLSREFDLGQFTVAPLAVDGGTIGKVSMRVHISLLPPLDGIARPRLALRQFRVVQGIEETLRQVRAADFDDPALVGLKHQLQERINQLIELRAIEEVIITSLAVEDRGPGGAGADPDIAQSGPHPKPAPPGAPTNGFTPSEASPIKVDSPAAW